MKKWEKRKSEGQKQGRIAREDEFLNPYHFIPLVPPKNLEPAEEVLEEVCLHARLGRNNKGEERHSGRIVCRLETEGPVVVGAEQKIDADKMTRVEPFQLVNPLTGKKQPAIPGSTIRGLISSLFEAATCSSMRVLSPLLKEFEKIGGEFYDSVRNVSPDLLPLDKTRSELSLAETVFGFVERDGQRALAGRIKFAHALFEKAKGEEVYYLAWVPLKILSSPKPPSPALYYGNEGYLSKAELNPKIHKPQGRKMYLHHQQEKIEKSKSPCYQTAEPWKWPEQKTRVRPLRKGLSFVFHVDFKNLSIIELGYLLYSLRPKENFSHKIGMGKSLGLGRVCISPLAVLFRDYGEGLKPENIFQGKYQSFLCSSNGSLGEVKGYLAERYSNEVDVLNMEQGVWHGPNWQDLIKVDIPHKVKVALETLGDPSRVNMEVSYPVSRDQANEEREGFKWFSQNDEYDREALDEIRGVKLPPLKKN